MAEALVMGLALITAVWLTFNTHRRKQRKFGKRKLKPRKNPHNDADSHPFC